MYFSSPFVWSIMQNRFDDLGMPKAKEVAVGYPLLSKTETHFSTGIRAGYCALISNKIFFVTFSSEYSPRDKPVFVVFENFVVRGGKTFDLFEYGVCPLLDYIRHIMIRRQAKYLPGRGMRTKYDSALRIFARIYSRRKEDDTFRKRKKLAHIIADIAT